MNGRSKEKIRTKPRVIVTGASGKTGSVVAAELLEAGYPVRALVHREDGRSRQLQAQGAEIAVADLSDVGALPTHERRPAPSAPIFVRRTIRT